MNIHPILITGKNPIVLETFRYWLLSFYEHALEIETICIDSGTFPLQPKRRRYTLHIALMLGSEDAPESITKHHGSCCSCEAMIVVIDPDRVEWKHKMQGCRKIPVMHVSLGRSMDLISEVLANHHHVAPVHGVSEFEVEVRKDLTPRERQIIMQIAEGCSLKEISYALGISYHTVNAHKRNLFLKTGSRTLRQLTLYAIMHAQVLC